MLHDICVAPFELKLAADGATGEFSGYGAVFGNQDGHGDVIAPGAFADSIAERKAAGRGIAMHVMHGVYGGDGLPGGVWKNVQEDSKGLLVEGKISGMNTDSGRKLYELVKDGALGGLSIGFTVKKNGATYGTKPGEPKRTLKALNLHEVSLVDEPSNAMARVTEMKKAAIRRQDDVVVLITKLAAGDRPTTREWDRGLQGLGLTDSEAERAVRVNFKGIGQGDLGVAATEEAGAGDLLAALRAFTLTP